MFPCVHMCCELSSHIDHAIPVREVTKVTERAVTYVSRFFFFRNV